MNDRKQKIDDFFNRYSILFNKALKGDPDFERTAEMFSDCCIAANPTGVNCGQNDERLRDAMQSGYDFYKKIGITSMNIISKEITPLDDFHTITKIHWRSHFTKRTIQKKVLNLKTFILFKQGKTNIKFLPL